MSRSKDPARRAALLEAGQRVLSSRGVAATTIGEVTTAAGVAKGTFYLYFRSKDELVAALRQEFASELAQTVKTALPVDGSIADWPATAHRLVDAAIDGYLSIGPGFRVVLDHPVSAAEDDRWAEQIVDALSGLLARGAEAGAFEVDDPPLMATLLFHGVHGMCQRALATGTPDRRKLIDTTDQLLAGIIRS